MSVCGPLADGFAVNWMWLIELFGSLSKPCPQHLPTGYPLSISIERAVHTWLLDLHHFGIGFLGRTLGIQAAERKLATYLSSLPFSLLSASFFLPLIPLSPLSPPSPPSPPSPSSLQVQVTRLSGNSRVSEVETSE